ncbi:segregation and condensation protein A [Salibacterium salarium]|uniref:segregation/condensation protein A n=1 Tax=Salibacterium salarium TaxID=284579 RepID=UPI002783E318|nr:segregation/condensation protein A [Salibacterium salarium]MDQ0299510.1 segregation and condensation protein A [Salibacterium salarium]
MEKYNVQLDSFEGPLDLLLHLIHQAEVDIYNIPVATITEQYLQYVQAMQELELDAASEYLVMAATLLEIKSKMLLPGDTNTDEEVYIEEEDPREELLSRLVEYKKYKEAAQHLKEKEEQGSAQFAKAPTVPDESSGKEKESNLPDNISLFDMLDAYEKLKKRVRYKSPKMTKIKGDDISMEDRMSEVLTYLHQHQGKSGFFELFPLHERQHIVVTFLAILELMKNRQVTCVQSENFEEIVVHQTEEDLVSE